MADFTGVRTSALGPRRGGVREGQGHLCPGSGPALLPPLCAGEAQYLEAMQLMEAQWQRGEGGAGVIEQGFEEQKKIRNQEYEK